MKNRIIAMVLSFFIVINTILIACALDITPLTVKREVFVYEYGSDISLAPQDYINANEAVLEQITLDFSNLENSIGTYKVSATYLNQTYPFTIEIVDTTKPVVTLKAVTFNVALNSELYAGDLIESVEDNSDYIAYFIDENGDKSQVRSYDEKGSYIENILVEDSSGNESASLRVKIVAGQNGNNPTLTGIDDIEVLKNSTFDPLKDVKATDGSGNDITGNIKILKNNVDTSETGEYEVIYSVTNNFGHTLQRTRKVTVVKNEKTGD